MVTLNVDNLLKNSGKSMYWLSKQIGMSENNVKNLCKGSPKSINLSTIDKICTTFNCTPNDFISFK